MDTLIINEINNIENEDNILIKYKNINKLHEIINNEEKKLEKLSKKLDDSITSKYNDLDLDQIISKFDKTQSLEKKIKYYHSISYKINNIIDNINN